MLSMQSELSSQQIWTGRSPVIFFALPTGRGLLVCFATATLLYSAVRRDKEAWHRFCAHFTAAFVQPGVARKTFIAWQQCLCNFGSRSFGRISAGEQSLHASSVACSLMRSRSAQSHVQQTGASSSAAPGSVLKFEKAAEGNQQLDRCEPQERRGASPDHSASSKVHSGFVCHGRCGGRGRVCWRQVGRR